jgi:hypothetical protein
MTGIRRARSARLSTVIRRMMDGAEGLEGESLRAAAIAFALEAEDPETPAAARNTARREALACVQRYSALVAATSRRDVVTDIRSRVS